VRGSVKVKMGYIGLSLRVTSYLSPAPSISKKCSVWPFMFYNSFNFKSLGTFELLLWILDFTNIIIVRTESLGVEVC